jgi:hypothetical protein
VEISITKEAEGYIEKNGKNAFIMAGNIGGHCGGSIPFPDIHLGMPKDRNDYTLNVMGGISIFAKKDINLDKGINITLAKLLWFNRLYLELK